HNRCGFAGWVVFASPRLDAVPPQPRSGVDPDVCVVARRTGVRTVATRSMSSGTARHNERRRHARDGQNETESCPDDDPLHYLAIYGTTDNTFLEVSVEA